MATQVMNIVLSINPEAECSYEKVYGKMPVWCQIKKLRALGEVCVVTDKQQINNKLRERGTLGLMMGYSDKHAAGTYRIYLLRSRKTILSRDVRWLKLYYGDWIRARRTANTQQPDTDQDSSFGDYHSEEDTSDSDNDDDDGDSIIRYEYGNDDEDKTYDNQDADSVYGSDDDGYSDQPISEPGTPSSSSSSEESEENPYARRFFNGPARRAERSVRSDTETPMTDRLIQELQRFDTSYNPTVSGNDHANYGLRAMTTYPYDAADYGLRAHHRLW
eukprot:CAMPEP_0178905998 /NCGR_PEP_ID=MMETSP0786-20121207/6586_1 /TAXON_ID=186022 /ORGANISM="Thalassionema frauenfeldii, Strain CCMP 1798" /LENGTH=274 /DNA_ID=CAMNT_0020577667 /DNA_START=1710 /DNA_END=2531 /DNA_ORIENTATION=-